MWPSFQVGDLLMVKQVQPQHLRAGDCIVYRKIGEEAHVIHRIVALDPDIRTRGDAMADVDFEPISPAWIIGKVEGRIRHGQFSPVSGGKTGLWAGRFYRYAGLVEPYRSSKGGRAAKFIRRFVGRAVAPWVRVAESKGSASSENRKSNYVIFGRRTVGVCNEEWKHWYIAWPYSLLIDPERLPPPEG